jgi:hypothetical protein
MGWVWMIGVIAVLIVVQTVARSGGLAGVEHALDSARTLLPIAIGMTVAGVLLLVAAMVHGMATDATWVEPGKVSGAYRGASPTGGWRINWFRGTLLAAGGFEEESGVSAVKASWRTGEWLTNRTHLRATMVLAGLPLAVLGAFATVTLVSDVTAVRLLALLVFAYVLARFSYMLARA